MPSNTTQTALLYSVGLTLIALLVFGMFKGRFTGRGAQTQWSSDSDNWGTGCCRRLLDRKGNFIGNQLTGRRLMDINKIHFIREIMEKDFRGRETPTMQLSYDNASYLVHVLKGTFRRPGAGARTLPQTRWRSLGRLGKWVNRDRSESLALGRPGLWPKRCRS